MPTATPRPIPSKENLARVGSQQFETHVKRGYTILKLLEEQCKRFGKSFDDGARVYDFGCGIGRVTIPLLETHDAEVHCSDVDPTAVEFLNVHYADQMNAVTTKYEPPVPFEDEFFDVIFSISVWSHLPLKLQLTWLHEMRRIMKKDALLLISTAGTGTLGNWLDVRKQTEPSVESLVSQGAFFIKNESLADRPELFPGVTDDWGVFYQTPEYVRDHWTDGFKIEDILERHIGLQELVVLRKQ